MKNVVYGFFAIMIFVLVIIFTVNMSQRNSRTDELSASLEDSAKAAVERVNLSQDYMSYSNDEYVAAVVEYMLNDIKANTNNIDPDSIKLTVEVAAADVDKGLISLNIVEEFTQLDGTAGHAEAQTTVIFDKEKDRLNHTVTILTPDKNVWKSFSVKDGDNMPEFTDLPTGFLYYTNLDGDVVELEETVKEDLTYIINRESVVCNYYYDDGELYTSLVIYAGDDIPMPTSPNGAAWKKVGGSTLTAGTKSNFGDGVLNFTTDSVRTWNVTYITATGTKQSYDIVNGGQAIVPISSSSLTYTTNNGAQTVKSSASLWYYADADGNSTGVLLDSTPITKDTTFVEVIQPSTHGVTLDWYATQYKDVHKQYFSVSK